MMAGPAGPDSEAGAEAPKSLVFVASLSDAALVLDRVSFLPAAGARA